MNPDLFDINGDGIVDILDVQAASVTFGLMTGEIIARHVLEPQYTPNGNLILPYDTNQDGFVNQVDFNLAVQGGVPFEILIDMYTEITPYSDVSELPSAVYNMMRDQWLEGVNNGTNQNASWYPIPYNPLFPVSSAPEPVQESEPVPSTNPAPAPPPVPDDSLHPLDINQDGIVDLFDALQGGQQYGATLGQMIIKYINGEDNYYDINGDGIVDLMDIQIATQQGLPQNILNHMLQQVLNPPPATEEFNPQPELDSVSNPYHPLDINQDGDVSVQDLVAVASKDWSQITKQLVINMIQKYMNGQNPYDINGDGVVSILDIQYAGVNGVPQNIIDDMVANNGSLAEPPSMPEVPPPPPEPGPTLPEWGLYVEQGQYTLLNGTPYSGPAHRFYNNLGEMMWTEGMHKNHSRLLVPVIPDPPPAAIETPPGQINLPSVISQPSVLPNQNGIGTVGGTDPFGGIGDVNGDGVVDVLDVIANQNQQSAPPPMDFGNFNIDFSNSGMFNFGSGLNFGGGFNFDFGNSDNQVGGGPSNNNNQNNTGGGTGGGGAY